MSCLSIRPSFNFQNISSGRTSQVGHSKGFFQSIFPCESRGNPLYSFKLLSERKICLKNPVFQKRKFHSGKDFLTSYSSALKELETNLNKQLIGQEYAVQAVSKMVWRALLGYGHPNKPLAVMLFAGPTGVGKTQLAKTLVEELKMIVPKVRFARFDLAEYQQDYMIIQLMGSPLGYREHEKGGLLTNFLKKDDEFKVLLLDEFEKMHPKARLLFLSLFDEGRINDSEGNSIDAKNTMIIATTNAGSEEIVEQYNTGNFNLLNDQASQELMQSKLMPLFKKVMSAELLNRFQKIIFFKPFEKKDIEHIVLLELKKFSQEIGKKRSLDVKWTQEVVDFLVNKGQEYPSLGARPLERIFFDHLRDLLARAEVYHEIKKEDEVELYLNDSGICCRSIKMKSPLKRSVA